MTDEEINRRVAQIEGVRAVDMLFHHSSATRFEDFQPPPYATNWAWCGPLVEKYTVSVEAIFLDGVGEAGWEAYCEGRESRADTPQRAICLAVIAANPPAAADGPSGR